MSMTLESFCAETGIGARPIGVYDAPDPELFAPLVRLRRCIFDHYEDWQRGETLVIDGASQGCPGSGYWLTGVGRFPSREVMVNFLTDREGLRETSALTEAWLDARPVSHPVHGHILIGPVRENMAQYLKTVTFFVTPDQLSVLSFGANYRAHPDDPEPVLAPCGSGCGQMFSLFPSLDKAQAIIGAVDIAMRIHLPPDLLAFTVTPPMLERLLSLDDGHSFLGKPFLQKMRSARAAASGEPL
jgi:hypothetical protein